MQSEEEYGEEHIVHKKSSDKEIKNINLGKVPIMVNSNYCVLSKQTEFRKNNECLYDHGGYFIINGNKTICF